MTELSQSIELVDEQMQVALASKLAACLTGGLHIHLSGDLGTGKTTFARAFIHASGYQGVVKSPTYTLVEPYPVSGQRTCYHFDLYRLAEPEELEFIGARDYFNEKDVCLVEWPEKAAGFLPREDWKCEFFYLEVGRKLTVTALTERGKELMLLMFSDSLL